jgi:hypothetical protein
MGKIDFLFETWIGILPRDLYMLGFFSVNLFTLQLFLLKRQYLLKQELLVTYVAYCVVPTCLFCCQVILENLCTTRNNHRGIVFRARKALCICGHFRARVQSNGMPVKFIPSICTLEGLDNHWMDFREIWYWRILTHSSFGWNRTNLQILHKVQAFLLVSRT